ncbi:uncharacterized protein [Branchiostoma lanceolatum]|uniref:uncharacterized protein n=1 Tax=Branchiostoma lanceolatum TaxID=7740 RepID=UPI0034551FBA
MFVKTARGRQLLQAFLSDGLSPPDMEELRRNVPSSLEAVLNNPFPEYLKPFLEVLAKKSPICGLLHPSRKLHDFITDICNGEGVSDSVEKMQYLQHQIPALFEVMKHTDGHCVPEYLRPLLRDLLVVAERPFTGKVQVSNHLSSETGGMDDLSFFPALPCVRDRGKYVADGKRNAGGKVCKKSSGGHPSLLPGLFLLHCEHGINYGFEVMVRHESPNTPFTVLRKRFQNVPDCVIYDNSCNLHSYCLNRDPSLFRNTWFLVDRLHWKNHKGCSVGYKLSAYPQYDHINSQVVEQCNASLKKLKGQLSYMAPSNFMRQAKLFIWNRNRIAVTKMLQA